MDLIGTINHYCNNCKKTTKYQLDHWTLTCLVCSHVIITIGVIEDDKLINPSDEDDKID